MKNIIDKFWIFWSKFKACCRFLFESKSTNWLVFYETQNKQTGEKTMTYQTEKTANMADIYNLMYTGYTYTAKLVISQLQEMHPTSVQFVYEHLDKSKNISEFLGDVAKNINGNNSPLKKMSKIKN